MAHYSIFNLSESEKTALTNKYWSVGRRNHPTYPNYTTLVGDLGYKVNYVQDSDNVVWDATLVSCDWRDPAQHNTGLWSTFNIAKERISFNINKTPNERFCVVRCTAKLWGGVSGHTDEDNDTIDQLIFLCSTNNGTTFQSRWNYVRPDYPAGYSYQIWRWADDQQLRNQGLSTLSHHRIKCFNSESTFNINNVQNIASSSISVTEFINNLDNRQLIPEHKAKLTTLVHSVIDAGHPLRASRWHYQDAINFDGFGLPMSNSFGNYVILPRLEKFPDSIPIFDLDDGIDKIYNYLHTGDDSGRIDPFDPMTPTKETVEDIKTDYKVFISPDEEDKNRTHFTVVAYNDDYIELGDTVKGLYGMHTVVTSYGETLPPPSKDLGYSTQSKYPTQGAVYTPKANTSYHISVRFENLNDPSDVDLWYTVQLAYDKTKESNCKVTDCVISTTVGGAYTAMTRSNILDGYRYTLNNGTVTRTIDVVFRHITIEDLKDYYPNHEDEENTSTGADTAFYGAGGLYTYTLNDTQFTAINKKLWSTDWTSVFKTSTIDPIKCVIACKSIPFTATGVSSNDVTIANMNTGVNANYVKTVKSFNIGTGCYIPYFNGDFTDITLTRIHCYLPYIGWVELPASECVSRIAYRNVSANVKHLTFKYIVDFVDGACRCIVSVNGTERWFFDGNCSIDVPVTSDNHTQAVSNAIRSGVQTGLSIASAVAGGFSENAMMVAGGVMGAIQNAPNIFPTYNYTATANGSGYINASMNTKIVIVVERPNVVRPSDFSVRVGRPCGLSLTLGNVRGFTKCANVDVSGITATDNELAMIKSLLENGVYL